MAHSDSIIDFLLETPDRTLSGEELGRSLGISRTAIWKNIQALQKEGYEIVVRKGRGYKLKALTSRPVAREIMRGLSTKILGRQVKYFGEVESTNNIAKKLARGGAADGTLVIASAQTKGRGRLDRTWESPVGGVFMSIILRPDIHPSSITGLTLLSGLAVVKAVKSLYELEVGLKWPNDLVINCKKLGGILSEMEGEAEHVNFVVVGIGIDANSDVTVDIPSTSINSEIGREVEIIGLVQEILKEMEGRHLGFLDDSTAFLDEYKKSCSTLGRVVKIQGHSKTLTGRAVDIDSDGALLLQMPDGTVEKVLSGDCVHLG
ncbi:MAG: biotin--[acetyl-CoA-carboxylase] ligase [Desulfatiglandales bacterium]